MRNSMRNRKYHDYTPATTAYVSAWDGQLWSISNPTPDASVPNFTAHHPDGHILCSAFETKLIRDIEAFNKRQIT